VFALVHHFGIRFHANLIDFHTLANGHFNHRLRPMKPLLTLGFQVLHTIVNLPIPTPNFILSMPLLSILFLVVLLMIDLNEQKYLVQPHVVQHL
jgi:hypothetical protein